MVLRDDGVWDIWWLRRLDHPSEPRWCAVRRRLGLRGHG